MKRQRRDLNSRAQRAHAVKLNGVNLPVSIPGMLPTGLEYLGFDDLILNFYNSILFCIANE